MEYSNSSIVCLELKRSLTRLCLTNKLQLKTKSHRSNKFAELQCEEYHRHSNVINQRSLELTASSSEDTSAIRTSDSNNESSADSVENCPIDVDAGSEKDDSSDDDVDDDAQVNTITTNNNGCIECNLLSNHSCRKCKKCLPFVLCREEGTRKCMVVRHVFQKSNCCEPTVDSRWYLLLQQRRRLDR